MDNRNPTEFPGLDPNDEVEVQVVEHDRAATDRSTARRIALQVLYEVDSAGHNADEVIAARLIAQEANKKTASYLRRLVRGVLENRHRLDSLIQRYAPEWPLEQVAIVDRNILRIAMFELILQPRAPVGVVIDEAVSLARLFGADSSARFINGVLGTVSDDVDRLSGHLTADSEGKDGDE